MKTEAAIVEAPPARRIPAWASVAVIVLAIASMGAVGYWYFTTGPGGKDVVVLDRGPQDGVRIVSNGRSWSVVSGNTIMRIMKGVGGKYVTKFSYLHYDFLTPGEFAVLNNGKRIVADYAVAAEMELSPAQSKDLTEQVRRGFNIELPDADRQRLIDLFQTWLDAPQSSRDKAELPLLRALDEIGDQMTPVARRVTADASAQIQRIVTPRQWERFEQMQK
jgi:hypothetical protein